MSRPRPSAAPRRLLLAAAGALTLAVAGALILAAASLSLPRGTEALATGALAPRPVAATYSTVGQTASGEASELAGYISAARAGSGVKALRWASDLAAVAQRQAARMADANRLFHNPNLASDVTNYVVAGENIGEGPTAAMLNGAFMTSPEHRANMLRRDFDDYGVGAVRVGEVLWVSEVFRKHPMSYPAPTPTQRPTRPPPTPSQRPTRPPPTPTQTPTPRPTPPTPISTPNHQPQPSATPTNAGGIQVGTQPNSPASTQPPSTGSSPGRPASPHRAPALIVSSGALVPGATGDAVAALQVRLGLLATGWYGPRTTAAVRAAQANLGLAATGSADATTLRALGLTAR